MAKVPNEPLELMVSKVSKPARLDKRCTRFVQDKKKCKRAFSFVMKGKYKKRYTTGMRIRFNCEMTVFELVLWQV